jgi:tRNA dimethylallyltransferase
MQEDDLPLIALAGPTASGKTAAALAIAQRWPVEIVSVDSALVYRGMDIGTAKPTTEEQAAAPHHLIDIRDPLQAYSAAEFCRDATRLVAEIRGRGRLPLLVGGTMLYFKALFEGLDDMPPADAAVRAQIAQEAAELGWPAMHARLAEVDAASAARLPPNDSQRIARALEVWRVSGRPLSHLQTRSGAAVPAIDHVLISLEPTERSWLHQRIAQRFEAMLAQGLLAEVWALMQRGDLHPDLPAMRCVGYRQAWQVLEGARSSVHAHNLPELTPTQMQQLLDTGIAATRQLAKRQITWLRSMPQRTAVAADDAQALARVLAQVERVWGRP